MIDIQWQHMYLIFDVFQEKIKQEIEFTAKLILQLIIMSSTNTTTIKTTFYYVTNETFIENMSQIYSLNFMYLTRCENI